MPTRRKQPAPLPIYSYRYLSSAASRHSGSSARPRGATPRSHPAPCRLPPEESGALPARAVPAPPRPPQPAPGPPRSAAPVRIWDHFIRPQGKENKTQPRSSVRGYCPTARPAAHRRYVRSAAAPLGGNERTSSSYNWKVADVCDIPL